MRPPARAARRILRRLGTLLRPRRFERELDEELSFHLEMQTRLHESRGHSRAEARAMAEREFGGPVRAREEVRDARGLTWLHDVRHDVAYAARSFARSPGFTAVALLTLALGIGATTAAFSVVDGVLLRPLPFPRSERIVALLSRDSLGAEIPSVSVPNFEDWRERSRSFEALALLNTTQVPVAGVGDAFHAPGASVSADFFRVLGVRPMLGRTLGPDDVGAGEHVAVVSHGFWRRALGSPATLPVAALRLGDRAYRIVGVLPAGAEYPAGTDIFLPYDFAVWRNASRNNISFDAIGRLRDGVALETAQAEMNGIAATLSAAHPEDLYSHGVPVRTLQDHVVGPADRYLVLLAGAVGFVLLVACANLANANLARAAARSREMAIRTALGAGRGRLVRQLVVESLLLAAAGGLAGLFLATWVVRGLAAFAAGEIPRAGEIAVDVRVMAFTLAASTLVGLLVGLAPALQLPRGGVRQSIADGGRGTAGASRALGRHALVGAQIALSLVLLVGAGLLLRSFRSVLARDLGFDARGVVTAQVTLSGRAFEGRAAPRFYDQLLPSLRALPGVTAAGATIFLPLGAGATGFIEVEGRDEPGAGAGYRVVTEDYFRALGVPLLRGRFFDATDDSGTVRVTIVSQRMAERYWPGQDPIGKRVRATSMEPMDPEWLTVVGVVGDVRHWGLESEPSPEHFVLHRQRPDFTRGMTIVVRGGDDPDAIPALVGAVRQRIRAQDPNVPVEMGTLAQRLDRSLAERRFTMSVLGGFGAVALVMAAVGVYGVFSFSVARRRREMAVRMALGAERGKVVGLVLGGALRVAVVGAAIGVLGALALTRLMEAMLFGVKPTDPPTFVAVSALLLGVATLAAWVPARRASRVDPMEALRGDG